MKIAFLNKYQNKVSRGAETFVSELVKRLSVRNRVDVISNINYLSLLKNKYDIIIPTNGRLQVFLTRLVAWLGGSKMVVSGQSGAGLDDRINLYALPDAFIGLTKYQSAWARQVNPFVKVETIPNGVDLKVFNDQSRKHTNTVLAVGAFTKEKRHELTISAVARLKNVKLIIVGSGGDLKDDISKFGLKMLGSRFSLASVSHDKMPNIYKESDIFAFPTVAWESFGIVLVEAMASGLPVVATRDPIRSEIVGDAGILIDPTNIGDYAKAIHLALNKNWGEKPRRQAEKFSWDEITNLYEELFKTLLNKK